MNKLEQRMAQSSNEGGVVTCGDSQPPVGFEDLLHNSNCDGCAMDFGGGVVKFANIDEGRFTNQTNWAQFNVDNTGVGNADTKLRIGSFAGAVVGAYTKFAESQPVSGQDTVYMSDQFGAGMQKVQGFSYLTMSAGYLVTQCRISTTDADQLGQEILYKTLNFDGTVTSSSINIVGTESKADQRDTLLYQNGFFPLGHNHFFEFNILAGKTVKILLYVTAARQSEAYLPAIR